MDLDASVGKIVMWSLYLYLDFYDMEAYQTDQLLIVTTNMKKTRIRGVDTG